MTIWRRIATAYTRLRGRRVVLMPFHEPMAGERTGISTATLIAQYGPIRARAIRGQVQLIAFSIDIIFTSSYWPHRQLQEGIIVGGDSWLPWEPDYSHDVRRSARHRQLDLEIHPLGLPLVPVRKRRDKAVIEGYRKAYDDAIGGGPQAQLTWKWQQGEPQAQQTT